MPIGREKLLHHLLLPGGRGLGALLEHNHGSLDLPDASLLGVRVGAFVGGGPSLVLGQLLSEDPIQVVVVFILCVQGILLGVVRAAPSGTESVLSHSLERPSLLQAQLIPLGYS